MIHSCRGLSEYDGDLCCSRTSRLLCEIDRLRTSNETLKEALQGAKGKYLDMESVMEGVVKDKESNGLAAMARENQLRAEIEQARARADTMGHTLAEVCRYMEADAVWCCTWHTIT